MSKSQTPANAATTDDTLPQTAVKPRAKDLLLQELQEKLNQQHEMVSQPVNTSLEEEDTFKKRYSDLRRYSQQKETNLGKEIDDLRSQINQLTAAQNQPLPKTREEFEAWKNKYPDIVSFIEIIAEERANAAKQVLTEELDTVKTKLGQTEKEKAYAKLLVMVPDLEEVVLSAVYKSWFKDQPHFVQEILNTSDDPHQIAYYIGVFRANTAPARPRSKADALTALDTSIRNTGTTPSPNAGKYTFSQSQIAKMTTQEFTAQEEAILEARRTGKILDDVSRKNSVFDV